MAAGKVVYGYKLLVEGKIQYKTSFQQFSSVSQ